MGKFGWYINFGAVFPIFGFVAFCIFLFCHFSKCKFEFAGEFRFFGNNSSASGRSAIISFDFVMNDFVFV